MRMRNRTIFIAQAPRVLDKEVRKGAMNVGADLLTRLGRSKYADDGNLGLSRKLRGSDIFTKPGVVLGRCGLVVIDTVEPNLEDVHSGANSLG